MDALVALAILSTTLILALGTADVARRSAIAASESRTGAMLLRWALDTAPRSEGARAGRAEGFDWRSETTLSRADPAAPAVRACRLSAEVRARRSGRTWRAATVDVCPLVPGSR